MINTSEQPISLLSKAPIHSIVHQDLDKAIQLLNELIKHGARPDAVYHSFIPSQNTPSLPGVTVNDLSERSLTIDTIDTMKYNNLKMKLIIQQKLFEHTIELTEESLNIFGKGLKEVGIDNQHLERLNQTNSPTVHIPYSLLVSLVDKIIRQITTKKIHGELARETNIFFTPPTSGPIEIHSNTTSIVKVEDDTIKQVLVPSEIFRAYLVCGRECPGSIPVFKECDVNPGHRCRNCP